MEHVIVVRNVSYLIVIFAKDIWINKDVINVHLDLQYIVIQTLIIYTKKNVFFKMQELKIVVELIIMIKIHV